MYGLRDFTPRLAGVVFRRANFFRGTYCRFSTLVHRATAHGDPSTSPWNAHKKCRAQQFRAHCARSNAFQRVDQFDLVLVTEKSLRSSCHDQNWSRRVRSGWFTEPCVLIAFGHRSSVSEPFGISKLWMLWPQRPTQSSAHINRNIRSTNTLIDTQIDAEFQPLKRAY